MEEKLCGNKYWILQVTDPIFLSNPSVAMKTIPTTLRNWKTSILNYLFARPSAKLRYLLPSDNLVSPAVSKLKQEIRNRGLTEIIGVQVIYAQFNIAYRCGCTLQMPIGDPKMQKPSFMKGFSAAWSIG